jgi:hypothetical protein
MDLSLGSSFNEAANEDSNPFANDEEYQAIASHFQAQV